MILVLDHLPHLDAPVWLVLGSWLLVLLAWLYALWRERRDRRRK